VPDQDLRRLAPADHAAMLRTPTPACTAQIERWVHRALDHGRRVVTVALPPDLDPGAAAPPTIRALPAADPDLLLGAGRRAELVERAVDEGHSGLGVLVSADGVMASSSPAHHDRVETALAELCRDHPVLVLCLYDRHAGGTDRLGLAVTHHPAELRDTTARLRRSADGIELAGEFDLSNLPVLSRALRAVTASTPPVLGIDLSGVRFLSVGAARALALDTAPYRAAGGRVELHGARPEIARVLQLVQRRGGSELEIVPPPDHGGRVPGPGAARAPRPPRPGG
jgi:anti-anti-sigma regulatory factor